MASDGAWSVSWILLRAAAKSCESWPGRCYTSSIFLDLSHDGTDFLKVSMAKLLNFL